MTEVSQAVWDAFTGDPMDPKNDTAAGLARVVALFEAKWMPMDTAPKDGKHAVLAIPTGGGFIYSIQGAFMNGKWMNAMDIEAEPLAWMPNVLLPDDLCPWTDAYKAKSEAGDAA